MSDVVKVGAVAYDPKVVPIWEGMREYFPEAGVPTDYVLFSNYEAQVDALFAGVIDIAWNTNVAYVRCEQRAGGAVSDAGHAQQRPRVHDAPDRARGLWHQRPRRPQGQTPRRGQRGFRAGRHRPSASAAPGRHSTPKGPRSCCTSTPTLASTVTPAPARSKCSRRCNRATRTPARWVTRRGCGLWSRAGQHQPAEVSLDLAGLQPLQLHRAAQLRQALARRWCRRLWG